VKRTVLAAAAVACAAALFAAYNDTASSQADAAQQPTPAVAAPMASDALDGTWELLSVIEDGKVIPLDTVRQTMIKDARIVVNGQLASLIRPDGKIRTMAFVTNAKVSPKTIDIAGDLRVGGRGIYMRDGDVLMIATRGNDSEPRPEVMASLPGTDTILFTFRRVNNPAPATIQHTPPPAPKLPSQDALSQMLVGTWGHQTDEQVVKVTINGDGTFSRLTTFKRGLRNLFDSEERTSGTWRVRDGSVIMTVTASGNRGSVGQVHSFRVTQISDSEVIYIDNQSGQRRIEWRIR
jgi:uncharacterized protein (TIGR03067 family)